MSLEETDRIVEKVFAPYKAAMNLHRLKLYASLGVTPPIVRWMPRTKRRG